MSRGNAYPDKKLTQQSAEAQMVQFLCSVTKPLRAAITADRLAVTYNVPLKVAQYRLMLAQQHWAAE
jgi:hypothetical protein